MAGVVIVTLVPAFVAQTALSLLLETLIVGLESVFEPLLYA